MATDNHNDHFKFRGFRFPTTTPVPDELFDEVMYYLSAMWIATPYFGWDEGLTDKLTLLPSFSYSHSFQHGESAIPLRLISANLGFLFFFKPLWWLSYRPALGYEFELSELVTLHALDVGREFGTRHGISLELYYTASGGDIWTGVFGLPRNSGKGASLLAHVGLK